MVVPALPTLFPRPAWTIVLKREAFRDNCPVGNSVLFNELADGVVFLSSPHPPARSRADGSVKSGGGGGELYEHNHAPRGSTG